MSDIDRERAIELIELMMREYEENECMVCDITFGDEEFEALRLARDSLKADEAYQLEYEKPEICEDAVSRKAVCEWYCNTTCNMDYCTEPCLEHKELWALPSVLPKAKKGHWICDGKGKSFADYHCSECGLKLALCGQDIKQRQDSGYSLFCSGCGAEMCEEEECK